MLYFCNSLVLATYINIMYVCIACFCAIAYLIYSVCYRKAQCEFVWRLLPTHVAENWVQRDVGQRSDTNLSSVFLTCIYSTVLNISTQQRLSRHFSTVRVLRLFLLKTGLYKVLQWVYGVRMTDFPPDVFMFQNLFVIQTPGLHIYKGKLSQIFFLSTS
jgi:hypothetical protein